MLTPRRGSGMSATRAGHVLLEVMVALVILGIVGAGLVDLAIETAGQLRRARERENTLRTASGFLDAVALWPREDLDRHLGDRRQGRWRLTIERSTPELYSIRLADSLGAALLSTTVFRRFE